MELKEVIINFCFPATLGALGVLISYIREISKTTHDTSITVARLFEKFDAREENMKNLDQRVSNLENVKFIRR